MTALPADLDRAFRALLVHPDTERDRHVDLLARAHPEHAEALWRALLAVRLHGEEPRAEEGRVGRYRIVGTLAESAMSRVLVAERPGDDRRVALKVLAPELAGDDRAATRLRREIEVLERLQHPHICPVLEFGEAEGSPYLVMPLLDGHDLRQVLAAVREETEPDAITTGVVARITGARPGSARDGLVRIVELFVDLAEALQHAHTSGVLHRDLKPANVFVTARGEPLLLDFGLASAAGNAFDPTLGTAPGTLAYMPPETLAGREVTPRSDVYGLAATLYEVLTGRPPVVAGSPAAMRRAILDGAVPRADTVSRAIPTDLAAILERALDRNPRRRYPGAALFAADLRRWIQREPVVARRPGVAVRTARWVQRHPVRTAALVALALTLAGLAWGNAARAAAIVEEERVVQEASATIDRFDELTVRARVLRLVEGQPVDSTLDASSLPALDAWLAEADRVLAEEARVDRLLEELRASGRPLPEAEQVGLRHVVERELTPGLERTLFYIDKFKERMPDNPQLDPWRRKVEADLVAIQAPPRLEFDRPLDEVLHFGFLDVKDAMVRLADARRCVARQREVAATIEERTDADGPAWRRAIAAVRADPRYDGLELAPQLGLLPLGPDPTTGLQEFVDFTTGEVPRRVEDGRLDLSPRSGVVLVLLPAGESVLGPPEDAEPVAGEAWPVDRRVDMPAMFVGKHEMTREQMVTILAKESLGLPGPLVNTQPETVRDALGWCRLRLPRVDEWEHLARAGARTLFWWGDDLARYEGRAKMGDETALAGSPSPLANAFGLHEVLGGVAEMVEPAPDGDLAGRQQLWVLGGHVAQPLSALRFDNRFVIGVEETSMFVGVRVVRDVE